MPGVFVALIGLAATLTSGLIGYFVAKLVNSGRIDTTTADKLWSEASEMRKELRDQVVASAAEANELRARLAASDQAVELETTDLRRRLREAEETIEALRISVRRLENLQGGRSP